MLDQAIDAAAARTAAQAGAQLGQVSLIAMGHHLHIAVLGIAHPAAQIQFTGFAVHIPPKANPLHATLNQKMKDHGF